MADVTLQFPKADVDRLFGLINRAQVELNKETKKAISWAGASLCTSLEASTKKAPKFRKIYKATMDRIGADASKMTKGEKQMVREQIAQAPMGVYVYIRGKRVFKQIKKISARVIPFKSKTTGEWLGRLGGTNEVHKLDRWTTDKGLLKKSNSLVTIFYSGLAKKAWSIAKAKVVSGGYGFDMRVKKAIVSVNWIGGAFNPAVKIEDKLGYAIDAFKTDGKQAVETAFARAANSLEKRISDAIERSLQKAVS